MQFDDFLQETGFYDEIDEELKKISDFHSNTKFLNELLFVVIIGGLLVNLFASTIYTFLTMNNFPDINYTIFGVTIIAISIFYIYMRNKFRLFLPITYPSSRIRFHLSDVATKFGFIVGLDDIEQYLKKNITDEYVKMYIDELNQHYQNLFTYRDIYSLKQKGNIRKRYNNYIIEYEGNRFGVKIRINIWISKGIIGMESERHDINLMISLYIIEPQNPFADDVLIDYKKYIIEELLSDISMASIYAVRSLNEKTIEVMIEKL